MAPDSRSQFQPHSWGGVFVVVVLAMDAGAEAFSDDDAISPKPPHGQVQDPSFPASVDPNLAEGKGRGKGKGGKGGRGLKGKAKCPGCGGYFMPQELAMNSRFCPPCHKVKNIIYGAARRAGKTEIVTKELCSDVSCKAMFDRYFARCGKEGVRPGLFILEVEEEIAARTRVLIEDDRRATHHKDPLS